ncbi:hypothetical protein [Pelatocladus sp. BLCC-F211]|uniref:hypothetical protein n=1 Tax=Pelatocladus sp. BLCC-F211 TaxID=3342752 RepID=UPI0035BC5459
MNKPVGLSHQPSASACLTRVIAPVTFVQYFFTTPKHGCGLIHNRCNLYWLQTTKFLAS